MYAEAGEQRSPQSVLPQMWLHVPRTKYTLAVALPCGNGELV